MTAPLSDEDRAAILAALTEGRNSPWLMPDYEAIYRAGMKAEREALLPLLRRIRDCGLRWELGGDLDDDLAAAIRARGE